MVATRSSSPLVKFHTNFGSKSLTTMPQPSSSSRSSTTKKKVMYFILDSGLNLSLLIYLALRRGSQNQFNLIP
ncbi:hypothetical protein QJS10_CPB15g00905 [Acorus calamus]|uniref:Transmembrane protein n=1 Tax=Acorus calamus TaxID=4465 RepID=A0AAV9D674_ACOCL|nr:hypothetical protein QJS10_CPB15g00905 [Acorus calamus]